MLPEFLAAATRPAALARHVFPSIPNAPEAAAAPSFKISRLLTITQLSDHFQTETVADHHLFVAAHHYFVFLRSKSVRLSVDDIRNTSKRQSCYWTDKQASSVFPGASR
nr:hypothetical protein [uncultured Noviherbaspirillum sp.]